MNNVEKRLKKLRYDQENVVQPDKTIVFLLALVVRQRKALDSSELAFDHALTLGYFGEGSTSGLANDALVEIREALAFDPDASEDEK